MEYHKYENIAYHLHTIKTDKFKTVTVKVNFKRKLEKKDITYRNLLADVLLESSLKYPSRRDIEIKTEDLYNLFVKSNTYLSGNYMIMSFDCIFLNEAYTETGMLKESLDFLMEFLFHPNVVKKRFETTNFKIAKKALEEQLNSLEDNYGRYAMYRLLEEMDKDSPFSFRPIGYLEDLKEIDETNLYAYYESVLSSDLVDIFVIGNIDSLKIQQLFLDKFPINTLKKPAISHYLEPLKARRIMKTAKEKKDINQSHLLIGCKIDALSDFEKKYVMNIYNFILGGGTDSKLFHNVRELNSLCYSIHSTYQPTSNLLIIKAGIDASSYKKAVSLIKKELINMEKGNFEQSDIEKAKITYLSAFDELEDSPSSIISTYISHEYLGYDMLEERKKKIHEVTKDMIIAVAKKVHADTVYLLEGGEKNEANEDE